LVGVGFSKSLGNQGIGNPNSYFGGIVSYLFKPTNDRLPNSFSYDAVLYSFDMDNRSAGSPIMNLDGEVVAVQARRRSNAFSEGVKVQYLRELIGRANLNIP
jgi:hypothetical protein